MSKRNDKLTLEYYTIGTGKAHARFVDGAWWYYNCCASVEYGNDGVPSTRAAFDASPCPHCKRELERIARELRGEVTVSTDALAEIPCDGWAADLGCDGVAQHGFEFPLGKKLCDKCYQRFRDDGDNWAWLTR